MRCNQGRIIQPESSCADSLKKIKKKRPPRGGKDRKRKAIVASPDPKDVIKPYNPMEDSSEVVFPSLVGPDGGGGVGSGS